MYVNLALVNISCAGSLNWCYDESYVLHYALCIIAVRAVGARVAPPRLTQYNHWGQRIDELETSEGWRELKAICFKEGIPAIFYERKYGEFSRLYGFAKTHLMIGDSHVVCVPTHVQRNL